VSRELLCPVPLGQRVTGVVSHAVLVREFVELTLQVAVEHEIGGRQARLSASPSLLVLLVL
jgi:hypothetical protein